MEFIVAGNRLPVIARVLEMNVSKPPIPSEGPGLHPHGTPPTAQSELQAAQAELRVLRRELESARETRRRQSDILRDVLYSSTVATFLLGPSLQLEFFTPVAEAMFRVLSSDVGRPFSELALAVDDAGLEADIQAVMARHERERSGVVAMRDRWYARKVMPRRSREQGVDGVVVTYEDITDGIAAGQLADAAREQIRRLIGTMRVPVAMFDDGLVLLAANPRFEAILVEHRHVLQHAIAEMRQMAPPADRAEFTIEVDGLGPLLFTLGSMTWDAAEPARRLHMVSVDVDRLGGQRGGPLIADSARLSEARHEIRQPLQSLRLLYDVLLRRSTDPGEVALLGRLEKALEALTGLLDSMFLQEELHRDSLIAQPDQDVAVRDVTRSLRLELGYHAAAKGVDWRAVDCSLRVRTDPRLLACLIRSLVVHALRRTSGGALLLGCRRSASGVRLEIWLGKGETAAASGRQGASRPEDLPAVALALARILNADIKLGEGQGPACSIFLPAGGPATASANPSTQPASDTAAPARRTICLVDDDENFLRSVETALDHAAIDVLTFRDADTFLEGYRGIAAECLFIDAQMPGTDGFRLIERLRQEKCTLPYIMITGAGDVQLAVRAMKAGAADFIEKPLTIDQIVESMNRARDQSSSRPGDGEAAPELSFQPGTRAYDPRPRMLQLTPRQIQVMDLVVEGHANKEIAARLRISQRTVENHRAAVMQRMGARSLSHLIRMRLSPPGSHTPE